MRRSSSPMNAPVVWRWVHFDQGVTAAQIHDVLAGLAVAPLSPVVALEVIAHHGTIRWQIGAPPAAIATVAAVLDAHVPGLRLEPAAAHGKGHQNWDRLTLAATCHLAGTTGVPLHADALPAATRALYEHLATTRPGEAIRLQLVLGRHMAPRQPRTGEPTSSTLVRHLGEHGLRATLRVGVTAATRSRTEALVRGVGAAWRALETPGVRVELWRTRTRRLTNVRTPGWWATRLRADDLALLVGWPTVPQLPGVPAAHPRLLAPISTQGKGRRLGIAAADGTTPIRLSVPDSLRHLHVLGPTGVGKSTLLARLILQDAADGRGVVVIDPKGDLVTDILERLPEDRLDDVVVLDPAAEFIVGVDVLGGPTPDLAADAVLSVMHSLYADSWGPRLGDILHASLLTLARAGGRPLALLPALLTTDGFRHQIAGPIAVADPLGVGAFWDWYDTQTAAARAQALAPLLNKLRPLLMRPGLRATFGQTQPRFALPDVFTQRRILLVSLSKGSLGPDAAHPLGSVVVALLWQTAQRRTGIPPKTRHPVMIYVDEVQDYLRLPGSLSDALAQARGLGVGFTLAHQHLDQLPADVKAAIGANARSRVAFALAPADARTLAATTGGLLAAEDYVGLPAFHAYAQLLHQGTGEPPVSLHTEPLAPPVRPAADLRAAATRRYGRTLAAVDADLVATINGGGPRPTEGTPPTANPPPPAGPTDPGMPPAESFGRRRRTTHHQAHPGTGKGESS